MNRSCLPLASMILLAAAPLPAQPPSPSTPAPAATPKPGTSAFTGKIIALEPEARTLTIDDPLQGPRTVHIGEETRLQRGSRPAAWSDLKSGQTVEGTGVKHGEMYHADSLLIRD